MQNFEQKKKLEKIKSARNSVWVWVWVWGLNFNPTNQRGKNQPTDNGQWTTG